MAKHVIGVDCGSGSVRAGLFEVDTGKLLRSAVKEIQINNPEAGYYEQSTDDIWNAVVTTVKQVLAEDPSVVPSITGIGFCATCSMSAHDELGNQVSVNKAGDPWNVIMWMDHRAGAEAKFINSTNHEVLNYVGGSISVEMETPKILWLKRHLKTESFDKTKHYFDLGDFLHWKASGALNRSVCCIVCKWTHVNKPETNYWDKTYFSKVGLSDAMSKLGDTFSFPGDSTPISAETAKELGLSTDVKVGFSMIDAHAGALGMIGCGGVPKERVGLGRLALISGTSVCHMAQSAKSIDVPGVWGPYYGVILKDLYLSEGGQSAAGKLLDHIVMGHVAYPDLAKQFGGSVGKVVSYLEELLMKNENRNELTRDLHIWPDFHGNRLLADPTLKGMVCGLTLSSSVNDLAALYLATIQALAYGSRHIKEEMEKAGHSFQELVICGGLKKSKLYLQSHADAVGIPVVVPECPEPVLLGCAMSAAAAATGGKEDLRDIVSRMAGDAEIIQPDLNAKKSFHDKKYKVFLKMVADQREYREIMGVGGAELENGVNGHVE